MRHFFTIISLTFPLTTLAAPPFDCNSSDFPLSGGTVTCTSLTIDTPINFPPDPSALPVEFIVSGDVRINASIDISGQHGVHYSADNSPYITGGPGAGEGGGISGNEGAAGSDFGDPSNGTSHNTNGFGSCNHGGGGGGGITTAGEDGFPCAFVSVPGQGGDPYGFPSPLRGGFGGGAGGAAYDNISVYDSGAGGGAGGALHINASGTITIKNGVSILARGGNGGNAISLGGGGGGGSGGVIWLESPFPIINKGIIDVSGGAGGINTAGTGGNGGKGGDGLFRAVEAGVVSDSIGRTDLSVTSQKLKSNISCGLVSEDKDHSFFFSQLAFGFLMIAILRTLFRFPKKIS